MHQMSQQGYCPEQARNVLPSTNKSRERPAALAINQVNAEHDYSLY
jgi:hypothetical protein